MAGVTRGAARRRLMAVGAIGALTALGLTATPAAATGGATQPAPVDLQILSFNDFHGTISASDGGAIPVENGLSADKYGGGVYLAAELAALRAGKDNSLTVTAGDLIGASPIVSGLFHDEPSIEALNAMKVDVSSVGNHEFDEGVPELLRMQYGGCHPVEGCFQATRFPGAAFPYLAANVVYKPGVTPPNKLANGTVMAGYGSWFQSRTGRTVLAPTWVTQVQGVPVGFIGMTLKGTSEMVAQAGIKDVDFRDEIAAANDAAADLNQRGVRAIVLLIHEGGVPPKGAGYNFSCTGASGAAPISGPIVTIAQGIDSKIDMVISGHTHQPYACQIPDPAGQPRWVTSAYYYGRLVTNTNLKLDRVSRDVIRSSVRAVNVPVPQTITADPTVEAIAAKWQAISAPLANRVVGSITADITRWPGLGGDDRAHESALADLIADAQLDRTKVNGAQIAFMNSGGVRKDLKYAASGSEQAGQVTYGEAFDVQPFGNTLTTMTMTGQQLKNMLEQQWNPTRSRQVLIHGVSHGFAYTYSSSAPAGQHVSAITLNGTPLDPAANYRVTVNSFLADGGDSFTEFTKGTNRTGGGVDLDEFVAWLGQNSPASPPALRITANP